MAAHPYGELPEPHFWRRQVTGRSLDAIDYDPNPRFTFDIRNDRFATAGSCFAQHFGNALKAKGGQLCITEARHPLIAEHGPHGYGLFSARYGNIYTTRQLRDLVEQAFGVRPPIFEFVQDVAGRWIDMLRPRAVREGFSSPEEAQADRLFHLARVRAMFQEATVFVFTLGLTECWRNSIGQYVYPLCPGTAVGAFDSSLHQFQNLSYSDCLEDLQVVVELLSGANPALRVLLTVSPVMLVATYEDHGALQASIASKSLLRAVAEAARSSWPMVDYFPSYEIIAGPQARGRYFDESGRDVTAEGVTLVMETFFTSRLNLPRGVSVEAPPAPPSPPPDLAGPLTVEWHAFPQGHGRDPPS